MSALESSEKSDPPPAGSGRTTWRVAVVGGGISGLAAAHRLQELCAEQGRPLDLVLYDAGSRLGGVVETKQIAGYRVELGADSFITNKPWAVALCRRLGISDRLISTEARYRRSLVLRKGRPIAVPEGFQLLSPVSVGPVLRSPIFSWPGKVRMALEYFIPRRGADGDESLGHFVRRRFGREALERLVQPLVGGIYTSDPEKLSLRATLPRFLEMERAHGSLIRALRRQKAAGATEEASGARYGLFAAPAGGVSELVEALATRVAQQAAVRLETRVASISPESGKPSHFRDSECRGFSLPPRGEGLGRGGERPPALHPHPDPPPSRGREFESGTESNVERSSEQRGFVLEFEDGSRDNFDAVVVALPAYRAASLIGGFVARAAELLNQIEYASTAIIVTGHKVADIRDPLDAFGLVVPAIENRSILAVSFTSRKFSGRAPEGCVQLRTFVGGAMQPELLELSDAEMISLVRAELESIFGLTWKPDFALVARWMRSMPQYHVGHLDLVAAIDRELSAFRNLALAGNAFHGVGIPDSIHSGEQAAERLFAAES